MKLLKKNRTFFSRIFITLIFSFLLLVVMLTIVFYFGIRLSLEDYNFHSGRRLQNIFLPALTRIYREEGNLLEHSVYSGLSPFLTSNMYMYVFNEERKPVFIFVRGERISLTDQQRIRGEIDQIGGKRRSTTPIVNEGNIIGHLSVGTFGFTYNLANKQFLRGILLAVIIGMAIAVVISFVFSFLFSKILSKNTMLVAAGLKKLAAGKRNFQFPTRGAKELIDIAEAAQMLSDKLHHESTLRKKWAEDIAHDLRTPVTALKTQFENMLDGVSNITKEKINSLFTEVIKIEKLVYDLFQLIKMETPEMKLCIDEITGGPFLSGLQPLVNHYKQVKKVSFTIENTVTTFFGDEKLLSRALSNIVQNAFQHVTYGGEVTLSMYTEGSTIIFSVGNTGSVDPEEVPKFFERMYRGENSRSSPGSGLGLTIARAICSLHGGGVTISQRKEKTIVDMVIPAGLESGTRNRR